VQPNLEVLAYLDQAAASDICTLARFTTHITIADSQVQTFTLQRAAVYQALESGMTLADIEAFLRTHSRTDLPANVARTLVVNGLWEIPSPKSISGPARFLTEGWQLGVIFTASTGIPFTPTFGTGGDPLGTLSSDDWAYPNRLGGSGCQSLTNPGNSNNYIKTQCFSVPVAPSQAFFDANCDPFPPTLQPSDPTLPPVAAPGLQCFNLKGNAGRNILTGPGTTEVDFSVFKNNYIRKISENFNVQFRAEMFNVFNHANFAPPVTPDNTDIFDATGAPTGVAGLLNRTSTTAREIQFAIKVIF